MDPTTLAAAAVSLLAPYLVKAGDRAAEKLGESTVEGGGKLLAWMKRKLTGRAQESLAELEATPASADDQADFRKQLTKALKEDPAVLSELVAILPAKTTGDAVSADANGAGAVANATKGDNNTTFIQGGG